MSSNNVKRVIDGLTIMAMAVQEGSIDTGNSVEENFTDVITNLLHAANDSGINVEILLARCANHFNEELNDEI